MGSEDLNSESHDFFLYKHFTDWAISPGILLIIFLKQGFKNQVTETKQENHKNFDYKLTHFVCHLEGISVKYTDNKLLRNKCK